MVQTSVCSIFLQIVNALGITVNKHAVQFIIPEISGDHLAFDLIKIGRIGAFRVNNETVMLKKHIIQLLVFHLQIHRIS